MCLNKFRKQIDCIDVELIDLLAKRLKVVEKLAKYKNANKCHLVDKKREKEVMDNVKKKASEYGLNAFFVEELFRLIMRNSIDIQDKNKELSEND